METYFPLKVKAEVARIRRVSQRIGEIFSELPKVLKPDITTNAISDYCCAKLSEGGIEPAVEGVNGFPGKICVSVNAVAAHGIPGPLKLIQGDILTVDIAGKLNGWFGDGAWTYIVGTGSPAVRRLLKAAWQATMAGISVAKSGNRLGDIGCAIEKTASRYGCSVVQNCVGHGIGIQLHEEPVVLPYGRKNTGIVIKPGMVFTIEPVLSLGAGEIESDQYEHEIYSKDNAFCAQFEHTVAVFSTHTEILTSVYPYDILHLDFPPYF